LVVVPYWNLKNSGNSPVEVVRLQVAATVVPQLAASPSTDELSMGHLGKRPELPNWEAK
jgi:hypothetical protein